MTALSAGARIDNAIRQIAQLSGEAQRQQALRFAATRIKLAHVEGIAILGDELTLTLVRRGGWLEVEGIRGVERGEG